MLKYHSVQLAFQEVPDEITLAINIAGCPNHCDGCHSPWLWEDKGIVLDENAIDDILRGHDGFSCICFMGGDGDVPMISQLAKYVKDKYKLKVAWYSGKDDLPKKTEMDYENLDYVKIGHYDKERGGLDSVWTNQRLLEVKHGTLFQDITNKIRVNKV